MGTLSKEELHRRILIGEIIIQARIKKSDSKHERISEEVIKQLDANLGQLLKDFKKEEVWREYSQIITSSPTIPKERKVAIDVFARTFLDKTISEMNTLLDSELKGREGLDAFKNNGSWVLPILVDDIDCESFRGANYDLRLGENVYVSTERVPRRLGGEKDVLAIEPGEFGLLMTQEYLFVPPDLMGIISIRLTHKQKGLVNISGFHVDPGYYGRLMFSVFNAGPKDVLLRYADRAFMIMFDELTPLSGDSRCPRSKWAGMENIPMETLSGLSGSSVSVRKLDERLRRMEILVPVTITLFAGIIASVIGWVLLH